MALETPAGGQEGSGQGREAPGLAPRQAQCLAKSPSPRSKGPFLAGKVLTAGGGGRACQGPLVHERGVSAACGGRRGRSPGEGATSSPTPVRISTAHKWSREGEGRRRRRQKLVAGWGTSAGNPPTWLRSEEWCPPPKLKAPWIENLQRRLTKLCVFRAGPGKCP